MTSRASATVLLSVKPRFATLLLDGTKTVEIRRGRVRLEDGATCLLYSSSPERALVGTVEVGTTETGHPSDIWDRWGSRTGLRRDEFDDYLRDCAMATAIVIREVQQLESPIPLDVLRNRREGFVTPQSYRFVADEERRLLLAQAGDSHPSYSL
ncbi:MAG: hypothetical protein WD399_06770 [Thermoleophilaceae bacterium]